MDYYPNELVGHEVIDTVSILERIVSKIKEGNLNAIELGCDFVVDDFKTPFGKITKSHIFNALRSQVNYIDRKRKASLTNLAIKCIELPYPPRELKILIKLVKDFGYKFSNNIIENSNPKSNIGKKHIRYLQSML